ncbi:Aspartic proteinase CDR1 [Linum perenne]
MHRDSVNSPFYDRLETPSQRTGNTVRRAVSRVTRFTDMLHAAAPLIANDGEYLMNISLGSPPFPVLAIADTGSDIIWTQCQPCIDCYKQNAPIFDPKSSSTYNPVPCYSDTCLLLVGEGSFCSSDAQSCEYKVAYGDQSHTLGDITTETLTRATMAFPNTVFGCGHENTGTFDAKGSGIIGLGKGPASLISQLGSIAGGKFSYCMVPYITPNQTTSTMHFGQNAVVSGPKVVTTPLLSSNLGQTFYALDLEFVSVGRTIIPFDGPSFSKNAGNIIIDSGTTLTIVPTHFLSEFSTALEAQVTGANRTSDPQGFLSLCYVASDSMEFPDIVMHFKGGDVALTPVNLFFPMSDTVICLAFYGNDDVSIYGNLAQQDFLVGYDLQKRTVSFKHTDCTKN